MTEYEFRAFISKKLDLAEHQLSLKKCQYNFSFWYGSQKAYQEILNNFNKLERKEFHEYLLEWSDILNSAEQLDKQAIGRSNAYSIALEKYRWETEHEQSTQASCKVKISTN